jgi:chromatin remodeling complex protein RSC6
MIRPTPEFDNAGANGRPKGKKPQNLETELRENARAIVRYSPQFAAILCQSGAKKIAALSPAPGKEPLAG